MFNNRKAKRFSFRKYRYNIISKELYERWKSVNKSDKTFKEFKQIWELIALEYLEICSTQSDGAKLGSSLGDVYVGYIPKPKKKGVDYKLSSEYGKVVYHENWNSNGKLGKIIYGTSSRKYIYKMHGYWSFKASTKFRALVKNALTNFPERFKNSIEKRSLI